MKFGFVTCVQLGLSCIEKIIEIGGTLELLITLNDDRAINKSGRIYLDAIAKKTNIHLLKINHINEDIAKKTIRDYNIDWLFIIGWSQIADRELLNIPNKGCIGIHPTLLPKGRGRAAIPWAIIKNLDKTGVTMFKLDEGVDTGDIIDQIEIPLKKDETATELYKKVNKAHIDLIAQVYPNLLKNNIVLKKQDENQATYWEGRTPQDGLLKEEMSIVDAERLVRATTRPYPGAFILNGKEKIIFWKAHIHSKDISLISNPYIKLKDGVLVADEWERISVE